MKHENHLHETELHPPLDFTGAKLEADRCYFCYDAPCTTACPTDINVPQFIRKISTGNFKGSAMEILKQNPMGGTCARVCPTESLCAGACVKNKEGERPIDIGALQRFSTDWFFENKEQGFVRKPSTGKRVAVVGAGPAGLTCAFQLSLLGHDITLFEAKKKLGGLNEYGLAPFKMTNDWAQKEISWLLSHGNVEVKTNQRLGLNLSLDELRQDYDAVFLGIGLDLTRELGIEGEERTEDAVRFIEHVRQAEHVEVGEHVVVIGGGSTAIDVAMETKRLGAKEVTLCYRRGPENMKATLVEQGHAKSDGVIIRYHASPKKIKEGFAVFDTPEGELELRADQTIAAIGQVLDDSSLQDLNVARGKVVVDANYRTSLSKVFAGGDCINAGALTVNAVQDGKLAARAMDHWLTQQPQTALNSNERDYFARVNPIHPSQNQESNHANL